MPKLQNFGILQEEKSLSNLEEIKTSHKGVHWIAGCLVLKRRTTFENDDIRQSYGQSMITQF
ncbi:hypothetical protein Glove_428g93 [Diversispora epigaea]|uniref:Uncharacterized protein n=1 Tax=Diversispora epigaea TaxID=1348612 RepID=A0A397GY49_9GLOM|nr:hypothetical protein Glove_428g93 [Diversispora epigaea]